MIIQTDTITVKTKGNTETIDITPDVQKKLHSTKISNGIVCIFVPGSTAGVTTIEFEPGLAADLKDAFEKIAPEGKNYRHHLRWGDNNGHSHVRSSILGTSLTVPIVNNKLCLGTWQQIVLVDFDTTPRTREVVLQFIGNQK